MFAGGHHLAHIGKVNIQHSIVIDNLGMAAQTVIKHQRLAVVAGQTVVDRIIMWQFTDEAVKVAVYQVATEQIVGGCRLGLTGTENGPEVVHRPHGAPGNGSQMPVEAVCGIDQHTDSLHRGQHHVARSHYRIFEKPFCQLSLTRESIHSHHHQAAVGFQRAVPHAQSLVVVALNHSNLGMCAVMKHGIGIAVCSYADDHQGCRQQVNPYASEDREAATVRLVGLRNLSQPDKQSPRHQHQRRQPFPVAKGSVLIEVGFDRAKDG